MHARPGGPLHGRHAIRHWVSSETQLVRPERRLNRESRKRPGEEALQRQKN